MTRPRGLAAVLLPLPAAAAFGLGAALAPQTALVVAAALATAVGLLPRVEWAALAVICAAVFENYLDLVSPWATEWLAAVLVTAWLLRRAHGPLHRHRLRGAASLGVALLVAVAVAFAWHPHGAPGLTVCFRYAGLVVVMLVLADTLCGPLAPRRAARLYVLACVLASVGGIVTAAFSEEHRVVGPLDSADTLAFFILAALPLVGTVRTRPSQPVWWVWACFVVLMVAGVGTGSRPALVGLVSMTLVALVTGLLALRHAGALLAVATTVVALGIAALPLPLGQALTDPRHFADTTIERQNDARRAALDMVRASPVVGLGPAAYSLFRQDHVDDDMDAAAEGETAHSTPLEVAAELGLLGMSALYAGWLLPAVAARRRWARDRSLLTAATLLALVGLATASLLESQQYALPLWFLAAMVLAQGRRTRGRRPLFPASPGERTSGQVVPRS